MSNTATLYQLACKAQYERDGLQRGLEIMKRWAGDLEELSDALTLTVISPSAVVSSTPWGTGPVRVYAIHAASPTGASNPAFVQVFNVASGGVTLGTTRADIAFKVPAAKSVTLLFLPGNDDTIFSTALTFGATTTAGGATGVAGADTPVVTVLANK